MKQRILNFIEIILINGQETMSICSQTHTQNDEIFKLEFIDP